MANPNSLKPFKSGEEWNGNAKGRPKGSQNLASVLRKYLSIKETVTKEQVPILAKTMKLTQLEIIVLGLIKDARKSDKEAIRILFERYAGKPAAKIEDGEGNVVKGTITIEIE